VYEGDLTVLDGGALQLDLKGYEGDRVVSHVVRFDFENDGSLRHRVWFLKGTERTLMLDVPHKSLSERRSNPNVPEHERSARAFVGAVDGRRGKPNLSPVKRAHLGRDRILRQFP
jgi:hypothetical protein